MSTPTGKPLNPTDPFADVSSHETWERAGPERQNSGDDDDPLRSPHVPKRAHARAGAEWLSNANEDDPARSPYAPPKARGRPSVGQSDFVKSEDAAPLAPLRTLEGLREHSAERRHAVEGDGSRRYSDDAAGRTRASAMPVSRERDDHSPMTAFEDTTAPRHLVDPDPPQPAHSNSRRHETPAAAHRDESWSDLERLEASLRRIQREQTAARLPRATQLPPVPGLAPVDEMFDDDYRSPRSLEPERLVPPAALMSRSDRLLWPLCILIASIFAAPIVYYLSVGGWALPTAHGPQMASVDPTPAVAPSIPKKSANQSRPKTMIPGGLAQAKISSQRTKTSRTARLSEGETVAMLQPAETGTQPPPSNKPIRTLDPEEIKLLIKQGEQFAEAGDLVTARLLFQRAAEAGDATAATALGATYDPTVLAKLGVVGMSADLEKARFWYQKAVSLGSSDAKRRLDLLANR